MSWERKFADYQNSISQKSADKLVEEFADYYKQTACEIFSMFIEVFQEACAAGNTKPTPEDLFRLDSYWILLDESKNKIELLGNDIISLMNNQFHIMYVDVFEGITPGGIELPCFISPEEIQQIIDGVWGVDKKNWRERIWIKMTYLWDNLVGSLMESIIKKRTPEKFKAILQKKFDESYKSLYSIIMIDISRIQAKAAARRYQASREMAVSASADVASYVMTYGDEEEINELAAEDVAAVSILSGAMQTYDSNGEKAAMFLSRSVRSGDDEADLKRGADQYFMWVCEADNLVCDDCAALDGEIFLGEEADEIYPIHPNCRCVLVPVMEDDDDGQDDQWGEDDINGGTGAGGGDAFMAELGGYLNFIGAI